MEWSSTALRTFRALAETGSFTATASALGYTQSAVSRQIAALERSAGSRLVDRTAGGARLTAAGSVLLRHASSALEELDRAEGRMRGAAPDTVRIRLGVFTSLGAALLPATLALLRDRAPEVEITTREGSTPALARSVRAGTMHVAVLSSRALQRLPDHEKPALELETLLEGELLVAVSARSVLGLDGTVTLAELAGTSWIASPQTTGEPAMGVWPALPQRPAVSHVARDWLGKLTLVAAGHGATTIPPYLAGLVPANVRLVRVRDGEPVAGRVVMARLPGAATAEVTALGDCLREAAAAVPIA
ncbi:LysR family transcriptional regulator [Amycolatopsis jiangsuensis]|uniref:DNA-binding transcriptional LysR family regulator n=1 Tax=Amycolatopsis jiangsuensis TaxID=1181879 RepID=A0A840ILW7_9PSEU|nr:LysR family transcriptional regulator [Amycolatopsis jiangsuensis]MBB4683351.1 DNA-binding transcriptional LysR family regulator [Amycolatopsis jiangsuensis]